MSGCKFVKQLERFTKFWRNKNLCLPIFLQILLEILKNSCQCAFYVPKFGNLALAKRSPVLLHDLNICQVVTLWLQSERQNKSLSIICQSLVMFIHSQRQWPLEICTHTSYTNMPRNLQSHDSFQYHIQYWRLRSNLFHTFFLVLAKMTYLGCWKSWLPKTISFGSEASVTVAAYFHWVFVLRCFKFFLRKLLQCAEMHLIRHVELR